MAHQFEIELEPNSSGPNEKETLTAFRKIPSTLLLCTRPSLALNAIIIRYTGSFAI